tara:strand:+ start:1042 stop:1467 length:426 start_codon:yes stop_codon:yes gene_type:complete
MNTTINNDESPEELVDKVIDQDSLKDKVGVFMMIMINFCNRKKMSPVWIESLIFRVSERTSETIIQVPNPPHNFKNFSQREFYSPLEQQAREFLFLLNKKDRELYRHIFSIYEKKRKKENTRNNIIIVVIVIVVIIILFSF